MSRHTLSQQGTHLLTRVSELIEPNTHTWDEGLVRHTFLPMEASIILSIPVFEQHDDFIAWHFDAKGLFSVKSAYRVHTDMMMRQSNILFFSAS